MWTDRQLTPMAPPPRHVEDSLSTEVGGLKKRFSYSRGQLIETSGRELVSFIGLFVNTRFVNQAFECVVAT